MHSRPCEGEVCLPTEDVAAIILWKRELSRWMERDGLCHDVLNLIDKGITYTNATSTEYQLARRSGVAQVTTDLTFPGVQVTLEWTPCLLPNAYYEPVTKRIMVCYNLFEYGQGMVRFAVAHEMGHAIIHQLDIPITGNEEYAADELASWYMTTQGMQMDMRSAVDFFVLNDYVPEPGSSHPRPIDRALLIACYGSGSELPAVVTDSAGQYCQYQYRKLVVTWNRLLGAQ